MPWYTYLAFKHLFPSKKLGSFFSVMSIIGVVLGVMVLVIVQSVMNGFQENIKQNIVQNHGDIRIDSDYIIYDYDSISENLSLYQEIKCFAPYGMGIVMIQFDNRQAFPFVKGVDLNKEKTVLPIEKFIKCCDLETFDSDGVIISCDLAKSLGCTVGDQIDIYSPTMLQKLKNDEIILPKSLDVIGFLETGSREIDRNSIIISLDLIQDLYCLGNGIHGITIKLNNNVNINKFTQTLRNKISDNLRVYNWKEGNKNLMFILQIEKSMMFFVLLFILLVASFSIACSLMTTVVRKTKEIGLLQALGANKKQIIACFSLQGLIIGIIGSIIGSACGVLALTFRNSIMNTVSNIFHLDTELIDFYHFSNLPVQYHLLDFVLIIMFSIIICSLAGLIPAWRVTKIKPSEALRNE